MPPMKPGRPSTSPAAASGVLRYRAPSPSPAFHLFFAHRQTLQGCRVHARRHTVSMLQHCAAAGRCNACRSVNDPTTRVCPHKES